MTFRHNQVYCPEQCSNCYSYHPHVPGNNPRHCFFITIRRSGRAPVPCTTSTSDSLALSSSMSGRSTLRDIIWNEFESIKVENAYSRDQMLSKRPSRKGGLRTEAPIPWLRWKSPSGEEGQTRKQENFQQVWDKVLGGCRGMWLTCTFFSSVYDGMAGDKPAETSSCASFDQDASTSDDDTSSAVSSTLCHEDPSGSSN